MRHNKFKWLTISANNGRYFVQALIIQALVIAMVVGLCSVFIPALIASCMELVEYLDLNAFFEDFVAVYNAGDFSTDELALLLADKIDAMREVVESMPALWERIELSILFSFLLLCGYRMLVALPDIATEHCINEFMSTNSYRPVIWYFAKYAGRTIKFALLQFLVAFPLDIIALFAIFGFAIVGAVFIGVESIYLTVVVGIIIFSVRYTMLALWLPSIVVENMSVTKALANNFAVLSKGFWALFLRNAIVISAMVLGCLFVNSYFLFDITASILTAVVVLLLFYVIKCINIVYYYDATERQYFSRRIPKHMLNCNNNTDNK